MVFGLLKFHACFYRVIVWWYRIAGYEKKHCFARIKIAESKISAFGQIYDRVIQQSQIPKWMRRMLMEASRATDRTGPSFPGLRVFQIKPGLMNRDFVL